MKLSPRTPALCLVATNFLHLHPAAAQTANLLVSHFSGNVYSLSLSGSQLSITQTLRAGGTWPAWLQYDNDTRIVYINDEANWVSPTVTALNVAANGTLSQVAAAGSGGELHSGFFGGMNGKGFLAVVQYENSGVWTYKLPITSSSQPVQKLGPWTMVAPGPVPSRQNKPHPHSAFTDPTGRFLLVGDLGADLIRVFAIDASSGLLTPCADVPAAPGDGPRHGAFWGTGANGTVLFIVNELANTVSGYKVGYPTGTGGCLSLTRAQKLSTFGPEKAAPAGSKASAIQVVGNSVYVANRNDQTFGTGQDALATYRVDAATGELGFVELTNSGVFFPRTFLANKAGTMLAVGGQTSSDVVVIARDGATGRLGSVIAKAAVGAQGRAGQEDGLSAVVWVE